MDPTYPSQLASAKRGALVTKRRAGTCIASTEVELAQLRIRVIALENLVIALLAQGSDHQLDLARQMATYISPRPGFTHHRPTTHAASQMVHLVERGSHFRGAAAPSGV